jgi:hypothetical protein
VSTQEGIARLTLPPKYSHRQAPLVRHTKIKTHSTGVSLH